MEGYTWAFEFENQLILWLQSLGQQGSFIYYFMQFFTLFGEEYILIGVIGLVYWGINKERGEQLALSVMASNLTFPLIKNIVKRTRPFHSHPEILNLKDVEGYSFPSGHSTGSASTFVGAAVVMRDAKQKWLRKVLIVCAIAIPMLVALTRMYLGAHYLTDVLCGLAIGTGMVFLVNWLWNIVPNRMYIFAGILLVGLSGFFYCTTNDFYTGYGIMVGLTCGFLFEHKVVKFENTKTWWRVALRLLGGGIIYIGLNAAIKAVVGAIYPTFEDDFQFQRFFRTIRYAIIVFTAIGLYPMLFKPAQKLWQKLGWVKGSTQNVAE